MQIVISTKGLTHGILEPAKVYNNVDFGNCHVSFLFLCFIPLSPPQTKIRREIERERERRRQTERRGWREKEGKKKRRGRSVGDKGQFLMACCGRRGWKEQLT